MTALWTEHCPNTLRRVVGQWSTSTKSNKAKPLKIFVCCFVLRSKSNHPSVTNVGPNPPNQNKNCFQCLLMCGEENEKKSVPGTHVPPEMEEKNSSTYNHRTQTQVVFESWHVCTTCHRGIYWRANRVCCKTTTQEFPPTNQTRKTQCQALPKFGIVCIPCRGKWHGNPPPNNVGLEF